MMRIAMPVLSLLLPLFLVACSSVQYLFQAAGGQAGILLKSRDIDKVLQDEHLDPVIADKLRLTQMARAFAISYLHLPDNRSYTRYADLKRSAALWNVIAADEFSITPLQWCFPVAGCVSYRGYFREDRAHRDAARLQSEGKDVFIAPIAAYSTLGWFADPVLNTMLRYTDHQVVSFIFHELAHQRLYIKDDTVFNESFARVIEEAGVIAFYRQSTTVIDVYNRERAKTRRLMLWISSTRQQLASLYALAIDPAEKRRRKTNILQALQQRYIDTYGLSTGDSWSALFSDSLNNATLAAYAAYHDYVAYLQGLLEARAGDFVTFYTEVEALRKLSGQERYCLLMVESRKLC